MTLFNIVLGLYAGVSLGLGILLWWAYTFKLNINDVAD